MEKTEVSKILQSKLQRTTEALTKLEAGTMEPLEALQYSEPLKSDDDIIQDWAKRRIEDEKRFL